MLPGASPPLGCGEDDGLPRQAVSGAATFDGRPPAIGSIQFQPDGSEGRGSLGAGAVIRDGRYEIVSAKRPDHRRRPVPEPKPPRPEP